jgi:hypothetical protein
LPACDFGVGHLSPDELSERNCSMTMSAAAYLRVSQRAAVHGNHGKIRNTPVNVSEADLDWCITVVDELIQNLQRRARTEGVVLTVAELVDMLMPEPGRRPTRAHCCLLASTLAVLLQRATLMTPNGF